MGPPGSVLRKNKLPTVGFWQKHASLGLLQVWRVLIGAIGPGLFNDCGTFAETTFL